VPDGGDRYTADPGIFLIEYTNNRQAKRYIYGDLRVHDGIFPHTTDITVAPGVVP
jgi:hypothetical protein